MYIHTYAYMYYRTIQEHRVSLEEHRSSFIYIQEHRCFTHIHIYMHTPAAARRRGNLLNVSDMSLIDFPDYDTGCTWACAL